MYAYKYIVFIVKTNESVTTPYYFTKYTINSKNFKCRKNMGMLNV
jgi:hypothetical protein